MLFIWNIDRGLNQVWTPLLRLPKSIHWLAGWLSQWHVMVWWTNIRWDEVWPLVEGWLPCIYHSYPQNHKKVNTFQGSQLDCLQHEQFAVLWCSCSWFLVWSDQTLQKQIHFSRKLMFQRPTTVQNRWKYDGTMKSFVSYLFRNSKRLNILLKKKMNFITLNLWKKTHSFVWVFPPALCLLSLSCTQCQHLWFRYTFQLPNAPWGSERQHYHNDATDPVPTLCLLFSSFQL